jgi:hypothetical protein
MQPTLTNKMLDLGDDLSRTRDAENTLRMKLQNETDPAKVEQLLAEWYREAGLALTQSVAYYGLWLERCRLAAEETARENARLMAVIFPNEKPETDDEFWQRAFEQEKNEKERGKALEAGYRKLTK